MREIKFRGKAIIFVNDHIKPYWVYGWYFYDDSGEMPAHFIKDEKTLLDIEVDPKTVGQFTGLKDKNGKEIYEGDVLRDSEEIVKVIFERGQFIAHYRSISGQWCSYGPLHKYTIDHNGEVIGNIYENPSLLES